MAQKKESKKKANKKKAAVLTKSKSGLAAGKKSSKSPKSEVAKKKIATNKRVVKKVTDNTKPALKVRKDNSVRSEKNKATMKKTEKNKQVTKQGKQVKVLSDSKIKKSTERKKEGKKNKIAEEEPIQEPVVIELPDVTGAEVEEEEIVAPPPQPKMTKREKQIAKQLQAKAIAKARAMERAKLEEELLRAAEASSRPVARSKSGRVSYKTEYVIKSSPTILFEFVTTPSGLVQWFADKVDINGDEITFNWKGSEDTAIILEWIEDERVRYRWTWSEDDEYFQFRIYKNDITGDTILEVIDFCEEHEVEDQKRLWDSQIKRLIKAVGGM